LNVPGVKSSSLRPFCYYQFYTFDEHYTIVSSGSNPYFDDIRNYEVMYNSDFIEFADKNSLEVIVFDDAAPIIDEEEEKVRDEDKDIIGVAKVPLKYLALSQDVSGPISIFNSKGQNCGVLMVKITVGDSVRVYAATQGGTGLAITTAWDKNTIL
jgi:hypothetical protein